MENNPFDPTETAAAATDVKPIKRERPKTVHHAAVPKGSKKNPPVTLDATTSFPKPGDPYWKQHPLVTEHKDGSVRHWGEDTTVTVNPNVLPKQMLPPQPVKENKPTPDMSDKAKGYSDNYYPANH